MSHEQAWDTLDEAIDKLNAALIARSKGENVPRDVWNAAEEAQTAKEVWVASVMTKDLLLASSVEYSIEGFPDMLGELDAATLWLICRDLWAGNTINAKVRAME